MGQQPFGVGRKGFKVGRKSGVIAASCARTGVPTDCESAAC